MKIATIIGARPQFIKAAAVSRVLKVTQGVREVIVHTGQHYDDNMSAVFFDELEIPQPDYNLGIGSNTHGAQTGQMLENIEKVILKEKPDWVVVYGDTNSTLAGALSAVKLHIPVAHVEAGLRSFNRRMPEEINRVLTDHASDILFAPTQMAMKNLRHEGISKEKIQLVGDVMYDAVLFYSQTSRSTKSVQRLIDGLKNNFYLATIHRQENTDDPRRMRSIVEALCIISKSTPIVLPIHPRTRKKILEYKINLNPIIVIDPVGYFDMLAFLKNCKAVFTDSGGLQKEAYFFHKLCITLRDETEWVELVEHGFNKVVGAKRDKIIEAERNIGSKNTDFSIALYGTGNAGNKIVKALLYYLT